MLDVVREHPLLGHEGDLAAPPGRGRRPAAEPATRVLDAAAGDGGLFQLVQACVVVVVAQGIFVQRERGDRRLVERHGRNQALR